MTAATQRTPRTGPRPGGGKWGSLPGSRCFASLRPCCRPAARPAKRAAGQKTAPGIFFAAPSKPRLENDSQTLGTHQENLVCGYDFAPGCAVAPNSSAVSGGSGLGNALRNIPLLGGILGGVGDIVSGAGNTALGLVSLGQSGTLGTGLGQIGGGVGGLVQITATDVAGGVLGVVGKAYITVRDVADVVSFGNVVSGGNPLRAVGNLVADAAIPDYGAFGGRSWGTTQGRGPSDALNFVDANSYMHDRDLGTVPRANTAWVRNNWSPVGNNQIASGPLGIAYVLAGTLPFLAADAFSHHP